MKPPAGSAPEVPAFVRTGASNGRAGSRWWELPPLAVGCGLVFFFYVLAGDEARWRAWSDRIWWPMWPVYIDLEILRDGIRLWRSGVDPLAAANNASYNYPHWWLYLGYLEFDRVPLRFEALCLELGWIATVVAQARVDTLARAGLMIVALLSPPVRLALERGNSDLIVFMLGALVLWLVGRSRVPTWLVAGLAAGGALLKLFPAALFSLSWMGPRERRRSWSWLVALGLAGLAWALAWQELQLIAAKTPRRLVLAAYGCDILPNLIARRWLHGVELLRALDMVRIGALITLAAGLAAAAAIGRKSATALAALGELRGVGSFGVGACIYVGTFAVGSNFSYRLIFLLWTLPWLWAVACETPAAAPGVRIWARTTLLLLAITLTTPFGLPAGVLELKQVADWLLALALAAGLSGFAVAARRTAMKAELPVTG